MLGPDWFMSDLELANGVVKKYITEVNSQNLTVKSLKTGQVVKKIQLLGSKISTSDRVTKQILDGRGEG
jgi:hypothetical protein